jgi:hypothetical protein
MHSASPYELNSTAAPSAAPASASGGMQRVAARLRRLAGMGWEELGYRGWQESQKWIDRALIDPRPAAPRAVLRRHAPALAEPAAARQVLTAKFTGRFFAGVSPETVAEIRLRFPDACRRTQLDADVIRGHHFDLLGYRRLWFGETIDWHLDPVSATQAPLTHWSRIDALDPSMVGDSKVVWELSRHQWVVRLAQAYALTGDERYANSAVRAINHWLDSNPVGYGINWASSLEVSLRLISWSWVLALLGTAPAMTRDTLTRLLASVQAHAAHIQKYLSYYYSPNTHLTGEALGLFYAGTLFPEFRGAARWRKTGAQILIEQADRQVSDDGVYFEQSTCYQRYTCEIYLHFLILAARHGIDVPVRTRERVHKMIDFLLTVRRPDGTMPAIGDADGGQLMLLAPRDADDYRGLFALGAAMFGRPDFAWAAGDLAPEVLWLLGRDGAKAYLAAGCQQPSAPASRVFDQGGYAVMRTGWHGEAHQLILDVGPLGCTGSSGHGHADLLSIQCSVFGDPCLVDAGTYGYTAEPQWRDFFRSSAAHSTVTVDGHDQAGPAGPFRWHRKPHARLRHWQSTAEFDLADGEHEGYLAQGDKVRHRRRVLFVKPDFWIVVDDLDGRGRHQAELAFQFAPLPVTLASGLWARADTARGSALWVLPMSSVDLQASVKTGELNPARGWYSANYGQRHPAPCLVYSAAAAFPIRILTLLYPDRDGQATPPVAHAILGPEGLPVGVRLESPAIAVRLNESLVSIERG